MIAAIIVPVALAAAAPEPPELWVFYSTNLWVDRNIDRLEEVWRRASKAGYRKVLLSDSKFAKLGDMDRHYFANVERTKKLAAETGIEIVPALFSIGYSNDLLWHDPDLAEGLPVRDALFEVKGGEARLVPDPPVSFRPKFDWTDITVKIEGETATVRDNGENARMVQRLKVAPYRAYHISVEVNTEDYSGHPEVQVLVKGKALQFENLGVKRSQDWKEHHVVFASLENDDVMVYFGVWGKAKGELRWRNWKIEEAGLVNVLRRPGAPCAVTAEGAAAPLAEGKDYERIEDPLLGTKPWKGEYAPWHEPPAIRTKLPDGTRLRVSWYFPPIIYDGQVMACISEPKTTDLLRDQARRMREAWGAKGYMMSFDEIRCLDQDLSCQSRKLSPGAIIAASARDCRALIAGARAYTWSDMFDPFHNARGGDYYLVRGDLTGSWEGLTKDVVVVNWNFDRRDESLKFFADRGHQQVIAGYYDSDPAGVKKWLEAAAKVRGVIGVMYTTWQSKWDDLEKFAGYCRE